jgi:hypothetical protein
MNNIQSALLKADFIIIGAGSGLSTASDLLYDDTGTFKKWFLGIIQG